LEPLIGSLPDQSFSAGDAEAEQELAFVLDQVRVVPWPSEIVVGFAEIETVGGGAVTITLAVADFVKSCTLVAFTVTVAGFGTEDGAV